MVRCIFLSRSRSKPGIQAESPRNSIICIQQIIKEEASNVDPSLVIVLCLNQGNATGLLTLLASQLKIGALIGLNVWMPFKAQIGKIPEMVLGQYRRIAPGSSGRSLALVLLLLQRKSKAFRVLD